MRPYQIFASLDPAQCERFFEGLRQDSPVMFAQLENAAAAAMKSRPSFVRKLPTDKKAAAMRRALARVASDPLAEEMLAVYFLECRKSLLTEWLDLLGLAHEDGSLEEDAPAQPEAAKVRESVEAFRAASGEDDAGDRALLIRAFAAQSAIDWPALEALLGEGD